MPYRCEEPHGSVRIQDPLSPALGQTDFRFKGPAVRTLVNQPGGIVLARGSNHSEARADNCLLAPGSELVDPHSWAAHEGHGEPVAGVRQAGAADRLLRSNHLPAKVTDTIGQRGSDVGRVAEQTEPVIVAEDG